MAKDSAFVRREVEVRFWAGQSWEWVIEDGGSCHTLLIRSRTVGHIGMMWATGACR